MRPTQLEIWVANADGSDAHQVTYLNAASFAPFFFPSGNRILFSSNYGDPKGREFDLWAIDVDGTGLERITYATEFDGFPMFSPDGTHLAFASNRNGTQPGETDIFVARWVERAGRRAGGLVADRRRRPLPRRRALAGRRRPRRAGDRHRRPRRGPASGSPTASVPWESSRRGTRGMAGSRASTSRSASRCGRTRRSTLDGAALAADAFRPASFSASGKAAGEVVAAGYGITAPELGIDDYQGIDVEGKIVAVRRFVPEGTPFADTRSSAATATCATRRSTPASTAPKG